LLRHLLLLHQVHWDAVHPGEVRWQHASRDGLEDE
jgi:hypothetical protein